MLFDRELAKQLWDATLAAADPNQKGALLELTSAYLFVSAAGFEARLRLCGLDAEVDLLLRSRDPEDRVHRELGRYVLVECKNTQGKTTASEVRNFSAKVRFAGCTTGALITRSGLAGSAARGVSDAAYAVRKAYHRDGLIVLVVDGSDLQRVIDAQVDFLDLLTQRYEEVRFDLRMR